MQNRHGWCFLLTLYALAVVMPLGGMALALTWMVASAKGPSSELAESDRVRSVLDERAESAREIRRALEKPVLVPEPLGPIGAEAAHKLGGPKGCTAGPSRRVPAEARSRRLPAKAREAFASGVLTEPRAHGLRLLRASTPHHTPFLV